MTNVTSPSSDFVFERFAKEHLDAGVALSSAVGWTHRRKDWEMLLPFSRGVVARHNGRVVGTAFRADFGDALSTINMIIVEKTMRSRGLGRALMTTAIGDEDRCLRLVATVSGRPLYEKLGFKTVANIICVQGIMKDPGPTTGVRDAMFDDLPAIAALESASFGGDRAALINWFGKNARLAVIEHAGKITGFAACRRFGNGHVIGPVVAPSAEKGLSLIAFLAKDLIDELLRLDLSEASGLQDTLKEMGLTESYLAPIMQRGDVTATSDRLAFVSQALA